MRTLKLLIYTFTLATPLFLQAQEGRIRQADKMFNEFSFVDARKIYLDVAQKGFESADLFKKIADSYYFNGEYDKAAKWYDKLVASYANQLLPEYYFRYAQSLRALKKYDQADAMMANFNNVSSQDLRADLFVESPDYLTTAGYKISSYTLEEVPELNSKNSDFAPTFYQGDLVFASARTSGKSGKRVHKWNNQPFLDLYIAKLNEETGAVSTPELFSKRLNSKIHESTSAFTNDGNTIYFTRNNFNKGQFNNDKDGTIKLKIYKSVKTKNKWSSPEEMPFNSDEYSTAHPVLNNDNTRLYFASDMPGTTGLSDIWYVDILGDGSYSDPVNVGRPINTEGRETFPFISSEGNLYFASDGHPGLGGLDVFVRIENDDTNLYTVRNLGEPVNSSFDDFSFIVNDSTYSGYFASNRKDGKGSDDIYRFSQEVQCVIWPNGVVLDDNTNTPISGAQVDLLDANNNVVSTTQTDSQGKYDFKEISCDSKYLLRASKLDYNGDEKLFVTPVVPGTISHTLRLNSNKLSFKVGDDLAKVLGLNPIYFDLDRFNIRRDAALELEKVIAVLNEHPNMRVDVRSHTDSRAKDSYNDQLSNKRNQATIAYLIDQGIKGKRLTGKGYGERQPVNGCVNGVKCSEQQHQLNRRSEFIIVKL